MGPAVPGRGQPFARAARAALLVLGAWLAVAFLRAAFWWLTVGFDGKRDLQILCRAGLWALLTPLVWQVCRRATFDLRRLPLLLAVHAAGVTLAALADSVWFRVTLVALRPEVVLRPFASRFLVDLTGNAFLYLAVAAVCHARRFRGLWLERQLAAARLGARSAAARLHVLTSQLQPHFLCNTLNAIAELVHRDVALARRTLGQLRALLLGPLATSAAAEVPLAEELELLDAYLAIQQTRFGRRLAVTRAIEPAARDCLVPHLLLQPLVENAVRHGTSRRLAAGHIHLAARLSGGRLELRVRDDGPGCAAPVEGVGLGNTRARLAVLHGAAARVRLETPPAGGAEVVVELPPVRRPSPPPEASPPAARPPLPAPPGRIAVVAGVVAAWGLIAPAWSLLRLAMNPYTADKPAFGELLVASAGSAAVFALATLLLILLARAWPIDRPGRVLAYAGVFLAALLLLPIARGLALGAWQPPARDEGTAVQAILDLSVLVLAAAAAQAATWLDRARDQELVAARHEEEVAAAALEAQRLRLDPLALAAAFDEIGDLMLRDPEHADERTVELGERLRALLVAA